MAFDQNLLPRDLRPLNIVRTLAEETLIAPVTTSGRPIEGFYGNATRNCHPGLVPVVNYPVPVPTSSGFVGLGFGTAAAAVDSRVAGWVPHVMSPILTQPIVANTGLVNPGNGFSHVHGFGSQSNTSDHASEEGGEGSGSTSARKLKLMCSFGGKILPRPSDGALRYVGGQTRIISVRWDISFNTLVKKMVDIYGEEVVIKYQLPEEDLDALVTVACPDDLENMIEEYEKMLERSSEKGSAKLRVFLLSASEVEFQLLDLQDNGKKYVEAVNGVLDKARKGSFTSADSTQNSEFGGSDGVDSFGYAHGEVNGGGLSPSEAMLGMPFLDQSIYLDASTAPLGVPVVISGPPPAMPVHREFLPQQVGPGVAFPATIPATSAYMPVYVDPYVHNPSQMGFPSQLFGTVPVSPILPPQHVPASITPQPFIPPTYAKIPPPPSSRVNFQPPKNRLNEQVVQIPGNPSYAPYQARVPEAVMGGGVYARHQIPPPEHEGWVPTQQVMVPYADCHMCRKALPHAHSDSSSHLSDPRFLHDTLRLDDRGRPLKIEPARLGKAQPETIRVPQKVEGYKNGERSVTQRGAVVGPTHYQTRPNNGYGGMPLQTSDYRLHESPKEDIQESFAVSDPLLHIEQMMGNLRITPEVLPNGLQREDIFGKCQQTGHDFDVDWQNLQPVESYGVVPPTPFGNPGYPIHGVNHKVVHDEFYSHVGAVPVDGNGVKNTPNNIESLFSNQNPWNIPQDNHIPTKPKQIQLKKEASDTKNPSGDKRELPVNNGGRFITETEVGIGDWNSEHTQSNQGSAEELIKQELQAVAEGVAASVLQTSISSLSDLSPHGKGGTPNLSPENIEVKNNGVEIMRKDVPEKTNLGEFPLLDGIGRLQIIKNSDLEELRELGSGTFGTVYHGKWRGSDVAIKRINDRCFAGRKSEQERMRNDFWNEAIKLADLHHPNVVAFYGVVLDGPGGSVATVTEFMINGSLRNALQKNSRILDKRKRVLIAMDVAFGMEYLHGKNLVHFDLKSDNLLVNLRDPHRPICKVGDLGLSKIKCQTLISGGVRGTLPWMAPELLDGSSSLVSEKVDVYSFGIVMWELLTGDEPYADLHYGAIIGGIVSNTLRPPIPEACDQEWRSLMERSWSPEPSERPNFTEIANELRVMSSKSLAKGQMLQPVHPSAHPKSQ